LLIDGRWIGRTGEEPPVVNPADAAVIGQLPVAGAAELQARRGRRRPRLSAWAATLPLERFHIMTRATR
jgi:acyl-CoA reductase-like NAD-dependent aldehyde dehydrogenase